MKYGFGKGQVSERTLPFPITAQVDNVLLKKVEYISGQGKDGKTFEAFDFHYTRKLDENRTQHFKDRMFSLNEEGINPKPDQTMEEAVNKRYQGYNDRLEHIAQAFGVSHDEIEEACANVQTFEEMVSNYAAVINEACTDKPCWLKLIPKGGYGRLPQFPDFIQPMSDGICGLKYNNYENKMMAKEQAPSNGVHQEAKSWTGEEEDDF